MGITDEMIRDGTATHRNGSGPTLVAVLAPVEDGGVAAARKFGYIRIVGKVDLHERT